MNVGTERCLKKLPTYLIPGTFLASPGIKEGLMSLIAFLTLPCSLTCAKLYIEMCEIMVAYLALNGNDAEI